MCPIGLPGRQRQMSAHDMRAKSLVYSQPQGIKVTVPLVLLKGTHQIRQAGVIRFRRRLYGW
jgi:hypothetical protein